MEAHSSVDNTGADGLSNHEITEQVPEDVKMELYECNSLDRETNEMFPVDMKYIQKYQEEDPQLRSLIASGKYDFHSMEFDGVKVTTFNERVWVPHALQQRVVKWYHEMLQHAGAARTYNSMKVTFNFKGMQKWCMNIAELVTLVRSTSWAEGIIMD